jgi:hypothetical protein
MDSPGSEITDNWIVRSRIEIKSAPRGNSTAIRGHHRTRLEGRRELEGGMGDDGSLLLDGVGFGCALISMHSRLVAAH